METVMYLKKKKNFCNIINVFTAIFDQFNHTSLLNKSINLFFKTNLTDLTEIQEFVLEDWIKK